MSTRADKQKPVDWLDMDFGDGDLRVTEYPDGMFKVTLDDEALLVTIDKMEEIVVAFARVGQAKGWLPV